MTDPCIHILVPMLNEHGNINTLLSDIQDQTYSNLKCYFCINQPEEWHSTEDKKALIENNAESLRLLHELKQDNIVIIDRSSKGKGWDKKNFGVGMARKVLMDTAAKLAAPEDILLSLDADTRFHAEYIRSVAESFQKHPSVPAISIPYFHPLADEEEVSRAILRYEIYMRHYALNLWRIKSPYHFTALGSAIAFRQSAYVKIGGMTPKKSGEDFYFLQKMVKYKAILHWNPKKVYPQARLSDRVFFGTGPALIKGCSGDWDSYPVYDFRLFNKIAEVYSLIPDLYTRNIPTVMDSYLSPDINAFWQKLRDNAASQEQFTRAVHEKIDGLRILQFLKAEQAKDQSFSEEQKLLDFVRTFYPQHPQEVFTDTLDFEKDPIEHLDRIRHFLAIEEEQLQKEEYEQFER